MTERFAAEAVEEGDAVVIHVGGEIDIATAGRLRDVIEPHLGPEQTIVLDLSEVHFMDSSILNLLVQARGRLTANGGSLVLRNPSDAAQRLLTIAQARKLIDLGVDREREAVDQL